MKLGKSSGRKNFEAFNRKSLVCLKLLVERRIIEAVLVRTQKQQRAVEKGFVVLREYIHCHEQDIATNKSIKGTSGVVSRY